MGKKFNMDEMQSNIEKNWSEFQSRMKEEWRDFNEDELAEARQNLHSFMVKVERRTHESADYVKGKLTEWKQDIMGKDEPPSPPKNP